jgi:hypothetical protein
LEKNWDLRIAMERKAQTKGSGEELEKQPGKP